MRTYEEALEAAQANVAIGAAEELMALQGVVDFQLDQVVVVVSGSAPAGGMTLVLSSDGGRSSLDTLTTVGLLHAGADQLLSGRLGPMDEGDDEEDPS